MGGSTGGIIIRQNARTVLTDPVVTGALPPVKRALIAPIMSKDEENWTDSEKVIVAHVYSWALCHLN